MTTTAEVEELAGRLGELMRQVRAGNEVLLTQGSKPVARLVPVGVEEAHSAGRFDVRALKGHRVRVTEVSQGELAEEMFGDE